MSSTIIPPDNSSANKIGFSVRILLFFGLFLLVGVFFSWTFISSDHNNSSRPAAYDHYHRASLSRTMKPLWPPKRSFVEGSSRNRLNLGNTSSVVEWSIAVENQKSTSVVSIGRQNIGGDDCVNTSTIPSFIICIYPSVDDVYVSRAIRNRGNYGPQITRKIRTVLGGGDEGYPKATFLDLGANIGTYSLYAASLGRKVISVEANPENVRKLRKSIQLNKPHFLFSTETKEDFIVLPYAVGSGVSRSRLSLSSSGDNIGGNFIEEYLSPDRVHETRQQSITKKKNTGRNWTRKTRTVYSIQLDDLIPFVKTVQVFIKVDIEGSECHALSPNSSQRFLNAVDVLYICMEWKHQAKVRDQTCVTRMMDHLTANGFLPEELVTGKPLNVAGWKRSGKWKPDMCWRHNRTTTNQVTS